MTTPLLADTWIVNDVLAPNTLTLISGKPGDGKSFLAMDLACHVAAGLPFHGQKVSAGRAMYVSALPLAEQRTRLKAWRQHHGRTGTTDALMLYPQVPQVHGEHWDIFVRGLERYDLDLIVIDDPAWRLILADCRTVEGTPAPAGQDVRETVAALESLGRQTGAAVLVTRDGAAPWTGREITVSESGSTVTVKVLDRTDAAPFRFTLTPVSLGTDKDGKALGSEVLALAGPSRTVLTVPGLR